MTCQWPNGSSVQIVYQATEHPYPLIEGNTGKCNKKISFFTAEESQDVSNYTLIEILCDKENVDEEYVDEYSGDDSFYLDDNLSSNDSISFV